MRTPQATWDRRFMRMTGEAASWSKDPDEGVGALVVSPDKRSFSPGYNGLPAGYPDNEYILGDKAMKNLLTCHAEANALDNAPFDTSGATLYTTKAPCTECAKRIVQKRIARVVSAPIRPDSRWAHDQTHAVGLMALVGIKVEWFP